MNAISKTVFALLTTGTALACVAAEFTVTPIRIFMTPRQRAVAVTVTNDGTEEIVMQADLYDWKQTPDGTDQLVLSEDMILSPPILKVPPKSRQVVRLARLVPPALDVEQTYRLIVREIPEAHPQKDLSLQLALAFSLPVFITPPGAKRSLSCQIERRGADSANAVCANTGRAYAQVRTFDLFSSTGEKIATRQNGGYILPAVRRTFEIKRSADTIAAGKVTLKVGLDDGSFQSFEGNLPE